ncbi:MAG TPA: tRNA uridine-5-carboxymethylaminomethyl(34) synthesis GTPase MnmE [Allosphingosinicella sp.]|nr:tRNA uridine-5-carboxymethylaminomethyl(34) synthesis GTPase MnmE [Allosphingosinicella sp.]
MAGRETIFASSSGRPPAAISVVRVSGPQARAALEALAGAVPHARRAHLAKLRYDGEVIDNAIILFFPGPNSATGDDVAEFQIHGGSAVGAALLSALSELPGLRAAEPGEFTRRAFENGRLDLTEVEGLADLLAAETQSQRRAALMLAEGALSRRVAEWQNRLLALAAAIEAVLDFSDEDDLGEALPAGWADGAAELAADLQQALSSPPVERLRDGIRVVIAGPPNAGKSTLLNALVGRDAAITSALPGTTRDIVEAAAAIAGIPYVFADTAGLRDAIDTIEEIGVARARARIEDADIILWLGERRDRPPGGEATVVIRSKADLLREAERGQDADLYLSAKTGEGMDTLLTILDRLGRGLLPPEGEAVLNARHRDLLASCSAHLAAAQAESDLLIAAEELRLARLALDRITGRAGVEDMLDALFGRFCIGK